MYLTDFLKAQSLHDAALHAVRRRGDEVVVTLTVPEGGPHGGAEATIILREVEGSEGVGPCPGEVLRVHTELQPDGAVDLRMVVLEEAGAPRVFGWRCMGTTVALAPRDQGAPRPARARVQVARLLLQPPAFEAEIARWRRADGPRWDPRLLWFERHGIRRGRWLPEGELGPGEVACGFDAEGRLCAQRVHTPLGVERTEYFTEIDGRVAIHRNPEGAPRWALRLWTDDLGRPSLCAWQAAEGATVEAYHYEGPEGRLSHLVQHRADGQARFVVRHDAVGRVVAIEPEG